MNSFLFSRHLEEDEELLAVVHKHWVRGLVRLFWPSCAFLAAAFVVYELPYRIVITGAAIWGVCTGVWWLRCFFDYFLDAWIVTDQGIIDVEWFGWFHRKSTRILYSDIEGVSYEIAGIGATLLRYGTVSIERISTGNTVSLEYAPHPRKVEGTILRNMETYLHQKNLKDGKRIQEILADVVAKQLQLSEFAQEEEEEKEPATL